MGFGLNMCLCLLLTFAVISSARNSIFLSGKNEMVISIGGRSLMASSMDDYSEPSANHGHDPRSRTGKGGRKGWD